MTWVGEGPSVEAGPVMVVDVPVVLEVKFEGWKVGGGEKGPVEMLWVEVKKLEWSYVR